jgi:hypothetical protein
MNSNIVSCHFLVMQYCKTAYSYGIEYLTFSSNLLAQSIVFAHELGHKYVCRWRLLFFQFIVDLTIFLRFQRRRFTHC